MLSPRFVGGAAENLQIRRNVLRGDNKMKKMMKPEVEAVRFDSNDVIATSGGPAAPGGITSAASLATWWESAAFAVLASEVKQYDHRDTENFSWYGLDVDQDGSVSNIYNAVNCPANTNNVRYAWFHNGGWYYSTEKPNWSDWGGNFYTGDGYVSVPTECP